MGIKFNSDMISENLKKLYPEPFPETNKALSNSTDTESMLRMMHGEIESTFEERGAEGVWKLIDRSESKVRQLNRRLEDDLPHDNAIELGLKVDYFKSFIHQAESFLQKSKEQEMIKETEKNKPSNSNGRLTDECIEDLETHAKHNKDLKIDEFFKTAHKTYSSCTKMIIEKKDGSKVKEKRGWRTLMDEVKKIGRNDIYYRGREPRTNNK